MKKRMNNQSVSCHGTARVLSVSYRLNSAASFFNALRFFFVTFFFPFIFTPSPICERCP